MNFLKRILNVFTGSGSTPPRTVLTPWQFTQKFVAAFHAAHKVERLEIIRELELLYLFPNQTTGTAYLHNFYDEYMRSPGDFNAIEERFTSSFNDHELLKSKIEKQRIVPIIKDREWAHSLSNQVIEKTLGSSASVVFEVYNSELYIVYAEDIGNNLRYLTTQLFDECSMQRHELRALACANLLRQLPEVSFVGGDGKYYLNAGGMYETSMLLIDDLWNEKPIAVCGDYVVATPARGSLMIVGSQQKDDIKILRDYAEEEFAAASYRLTPKLFIRRNGTFVEFPD